MLRNSPQGYGWVSILLHWSIAFALFGLFGLGAWMVELGLYDSWYHKAPALHISLGVVTVIFMLFRYGWRWTNPVPAPVPQPNLLKLAAATVHQLFYFLVLALGISGYMISTAEDDPLLVFNRVAIPAIHFNLNNQADLAGEIHFWLAWSLIIFAGIHAIAALKHHFMSHDATLIRMLTTRPQKEINHE